MDETTHPYINNKGLNFKYIIQIDVTYDSVLKKQKD